MRQHLSIWLFWWHDDGIKSDVFSKMSIQNKIFIWNPLETPEKSQETKPGTWKSLETPWNSLETSWNSLEILGNLLQLFGKPWNSTEITNTPETKCYMYIADSRRFSVASLDLLVLFENFLTNFGENQKKGGKLENLLFSHHSQSILP